MTKFLSNLIGNEYLATIIMSLFPLIELKGGIVYAQSANILPFLSFALAYIGSTVVFIPIYFLLKPVLSLLKRIKGFNGFALKIENYFQNKADKTLEERRTLNKKERSENFLKKLGVFVFVAIPLPMTGVWTGTALAVFFNLKFFESVLPIVAGNFIAGLLILLLSFVCTLIGINLDYVLYGLCILALILLVIVIVKICKIKPNRN